MASVARIFLQQSRPRPWPVLSRASRRASIQHPAQRQHLFSASSIHYADQTSKDGPMGGEDAGFSKVTIEQDASSSSKATQPELQGRTSKTRSPKELQSMSKAARQAYCDAEPGLMLSDLQEDGRNLDDDVIRDNTRRNMRGIGFGNDPGLDSDEDFEVEEDDQKKVAMGFWAEGEPELGPDEDYHGDDLTSAGHGELQKMRDLREYARLIAWELPLLGQLARPFEPPLADTPFRFRYTSYFGESHPAVNKVVVEFCPSDLALTEPQLSKLIKLAGPRYDPESTIVKLSCEKFDTQAQNKRFLGETIETLMTEAKDPTDTFEDVPFDFRHHKPKARFEFPKEWVLTKERKQFLDEKRQTIAKRDDERMYTGKLIDGKTIVENSLPFTMPAEPIMVGVSRTNRRV